MPKGDFYAVVPAMDPPAPMTYAVIDATDEDGALVPPAPPLDERTKDALLAEIDARNATRPDDLHIAKTGNKADLIAALEADDAAQLPPIPTADGAAGDKE